MIINDYNMPNHTIDHDTGLCNKDDNGTVGLEENNIITERKINRRTINRTRLQVQILIGY